MKYRIGLSLSLGLAWLLWSGHYTPLLLSLGALSCIGVVVVAGAIKAEVAPLGVPFRVLFYLPWLLLEIAKANIDVAWRILHPRKPIQPSILRVRSSRQGDVALTILANSITLTPGTVSIDLRGREIVVHALTRVAAEGVESGEMDRRVARLDG